MSNRSYDANNVYDDLDKYQRLVDRDLAIHREKMAKDEHYQQHHRTDTNYILLHQNREMLRKTQYHNDQLLGRAPAPFNLAK